MATTVAKRKRVRKWNTLKVTLSEAMELRDYSERMRKLFLRGGNEAVAEKHAKRKAALQAFIDRHWPY